MNIVALDLGKYKIVSYEYNSENGYIEDSMADAQNSFVGVENNYLKNCRFLCKMSLHDKDLAKSVVSAQIESLKLYT